MLYHIEVKNQGSYVAEYIIEAANVLAAINLVENYYGEPVRIEKAIIEDEDGSRHEVMIVNHWHGYAFHAQTIDHKTRTTGWSDEARLGMANITKEMVRRVPLTVVEG
jgi:hypothetical protein